MRMWVAEMAMAAAKIASEAMKSEALKTGGLQFRQLGLRKRSLLSVLLCLLREEGGAESGISASQATPPSTSCP
jgi:hypothetical protein